MKNIEKFKSDFQSQRSLNGHKFEAEVGRILKTVSCLTDLHISQETTIDLTAKSYKGHDFVRPDAIFKLTNPKLSKLICTIDATTSERGDRTCQKLFNIIKANVGCSGNIFIGFLVFPAQSSFEGTNPNFRVSLKNSEEENKAIERLCFMLVNDYKFSPNIFAVRVDWLPDIIKGLNSLSFKEKDISVEKIYNQLKNIILKLHPELTPTNFKKTYPSVRI